MRETLCRQISLVSERRASVSKTDVIRQAGEAREDVHVVTVAFDG